MTRTKLILESFRYYWRTHLGVIAGAAVATAVLVGALVVGDSVGHTLRTMALQQLGGTHAAMATGDRYFTADLAGKVGEAVDAPAAPVADLSGLAVRPDGEGRANDVHVLGVNERFWDIGGVDPPLDADDDRGLALNRRLADRLNVETGDRVVLRFAKPSALSRDIPLGSETEDSVSISMTVGAILGSDRFGQFSLQGSQVPPLNAFVPLSLLQEEAEIEGRANIVLLGDKRDGTALKAEEANRALSEHWRLSDANVELRELDEPGVLELRSSRVFIDPPIVEAAQRAAPSARQYLTYFVNELRAGPDRATPYSMVTALRPPESDDASPRNPLPVGMDEHGIVVTEWLAEDLDLSVGDALTLNYPVLGTGREVEDSNAAFTVRRIVPTEGPGGDRHLMPDFPGLANVDSPFEWRPPPELGIDLNRIRDKDERYWDEHRGAPKAFVHLDWAAPPDAASRNAAPRNADRWGTRFGDLTVLRWDLDEHNPADLAGAIRSEMDPASIGLFFRPIREAALEATRQGTGAQFGGLFLSLSIFLMVAALLLTALLFVFGVEQRSSETGTLLALGYTPRQVRRLWLAEGGLLAVIGAAVGTALGIAYTKAVLWALTALWQGAVGGAPLQYHANASTLVIGAAAGVIVALLAMGWVLRRQAKQPARALLASRFGLETAGETGGRRGRGWVLWLGVGCIVLALGLVGIGAAELVEAERGIFFGAGTLLLVGGLCLARSLLRFSGGRTSATALSLTRLGWRNSARRVGRSLAAITMLACGTFLIVSLNAFRQSPLENADQPASGTGGFDLYAESTLPVYHDLTSEAGRQQFALDHEALRGVSIVQMRLRGGDDASCRNLNRPQTPALLGVDPDKLSGRFSFVQTIGSADVDDPWQLLSMNDDAPEKPVPAVVDQTVAQWTLKKGLGGTLEYRDERGETFKIRIVGTLSQSVLQGRLLISEQQFQRRYPSNSGYRVMLAEASGPSAAEVRRTLERALADVGFSAMPTTQRLADFTAVQNTYLTIFGVLGGLGLVLGCIGLGLVVLRNVLERRGELALMRSVGYARRSLRWLVLSEHWGLLGIGLGLGIVAALVAVAPALASPGMEIPYGTLGWTLGAIAVSGVLWTALAAFAAFRGPLIEALRRE